MRSVKDDFQLLASLMIKKMTMLLVENMEHIEQKDLFCYSSIQSTL